VVFITGPHAFKNGYHRFMYHQGSAFENKKDGLFVGMNGGKVRKLEVVPSNISKVAWDTQIS
jgi:hypothetical protein